MSRSRLRRGDADRACRRNVSSGCKLIQGSTQSRSRRHDRGQALSHLGHLHGGLRLCLLAQLVGSASGAGDQTDQRSINSAPLGTALSVPGGQLPPGRAGLGGFVRGATYLHRQRQQDVGVPGAIEAQRFIDFDIPPPHIDTRGMHTQQLPR